MRFGILGPLEVRSAGGGAVPVGGPRPRALLVLLSLNAGRTVGMEQLIAGQYGDDPPAGAANAVQAHVSRLRRGLPAGLIEFTAGGYRLVVDPEDVDAYRFERLAAEGRRLLGAGRHARAAAVLREALGLWRGPALADLPHGRAPAVRLEELRLTATEDLVEAELALSEGTPIADLRALVSAHPLRERLRGQLMRALRAAGRPAEAMTEFEAARRLLADELGADPSPELTAIHLAILRAERPAPPPRPALPAQLTSFVGRDGELDRLDGLRDARLVTILGPGGTGKTRLAIESAGRGGREVRFVKLSTLDGAEQVPQAVLGALGLREPGFPSPAGDPTRRLVAALDRDLLLVLDNCEHVVAGVAALARTLLAECPGLAILATSREPLGLTGETLLPLAPLDTPPPEVAADDAAAYPAVRLFAERAAAVRPDFVIGPGNARTVIGICAALDGLPLAIELAAARLRQFPVEEIAARLAEHGRFRLLSRGDRTAAPRHRTLRAVVEWSWDLLGGAEQTMARRLAVFTGGAPLAAVEAVCDVPDADEVLADLVDRSLVETDGERYRMLETIRLFCAERLADAGERERLRRAHAGYHLALAQRADPHLLGAGQLDWLARLSAEHGNLMAALRWAARSDRPDDREIAFRMVAALAGYWWLTGRRNQVGQVAAELLGYLPEGVDGPAVPEGLAEEYVSCVVHAVPRAASKHWTRAGQIMRTRCRALRHPFGAAVWGMASGPPDQLTPDLERLLDSDPWNVALGRLSRGLLGVLGGRPAEGEAELADVLGLFRALGERWGTAQALDWLAVVAGWRGEWDRAHGLWTEALALLEQLGAPEECAELLCHRAECLVRRGDLDAAGADYRRAAELSAKAGRPETSAEVHLGLAGIARRRGDVREAADRLGRALDRTRADDFAAGSTRVRVLTALGRLAECSGEPAEALRRHREALDLARSSPLAAELASAIEGQAGAILLATEHAFDGRADAVLLATEHAFDGQAGAILLATEHAFDGRTDAILLAGELAGAVKGQVGAGVLPAGSGARAALLLGAAVALRGIAVTGDVDVARVADRARELIGAAAFARGYARGAALTPGQVLTVLDEGEA